MEGVAGGLLPPEPHRCPLLSPRPSAPLSPRGRSLVSHLPALPGAAMVTKLPDPLRALGPGQQEFDRLCGTGRVSLGERLGSGL